MMIDCNNDLGADNQDNEQINEEYHNHNLRRKADR